MASSSHDSPGASIYNGYMFTVNVDVSPEQFDWQGHLNNVAIVQLLQDMRVVYVRGTLSPEEVEAKYSDVVLVVREMHVLYESEGRPGERFGGGVRAVSRTDKAFVLEQVLAELETERVVARAWLVMITIDRGTGRPVSIPWDLWHQVELREQRTIAPSPSTPRPPWGPPNPS